MKFVIPVVAFLLSSVAANAEPILQPEGLKRGVQYRLTFTTSTKRDATSPNIQDYNDFVQATADAAPVVGTWGLEWKAMVATEEVGALENTGTDFNVDPGVPVYRVDGVLFGAGNIGLWNLPGQSDRNGIAEPNIDETGNPIAFTEASDLFVWTGTFSTGIPIPETIPLGSAGLTRYSYGIAETTSKRDNFWVGNRDAMEEHRFYALSEVVTAVPEPSSFSLLSCCFVIILFLRKHDRGFVGVLPTKLAVLTALLLGCGQFNCDAQTIEPVLQPPGLKRGDRYRLIFVTSQQRDATSTKIEDYNEFVQRVADASPVVGSWGLDWKAIASTETVDARDNIGAGPDDPILPVYRLDGTPFTDPGTGPLFEFESHPGSPKVSLVKYTELGTVPPASDSRFIVGAEVWTGTSSEGVAATNFGPLGGNTEGAAAYGDSLDGTLHVYFDGSQPVEIEASFYGVSEIITVVPEPSSSNLVFCCFSTILFLRHRDRNRAGVPSLNLAAVTFVLLGFVQLTCSAQTVGPTLQPSDLQPGDQYRLIFTTSQGRDTTSSNIADYNDFVQSVADSAPELGTWGLNWTVMASTPSVDARDNTETNPLVYGVGVPIYRVDGQRFVNNYEGLWGDIADGVPVEGPRRSPLTNLAMTELGTVPEFDPEFLPDTRVTLVATGTTLNGISFDALGDNSRTRVGTAHGTSTRDLLNAQGRGELALTRFYAVSEVITVVPEPSSSSLLTLACSLFLLFRDRPPRCALRSGQHW